MLRMERSNGRHSHQYREADGKAGSFSLFERVHLQLPVRALRIRARVHSPSTVAWSAPSRCSLVFDFEARRRDDRSHTPMTRHISLVARAVLALGLAIGFYVLAIAIACGFLWIAMDKSVLIS